MTDEARVIDECHAILDECRVLDGGYTLQDRIRHVIDNGEKAANDRISKMLDESEAEPMTDEAVEHTMALVGDLAAKETVRKLQRDIAAANAELDKLRALLSGTGMKVETDHEGDLYIRCAGVKHYPAAPHPRPE